MKADSTIQLQTGDALIIVDVQNDFLPGGHLPVPDSDKIVPVLNRYIQAFESHNLPVYATRDWHPAKHSSFTEQGGPWPRHCVAHTPGAQFAPTMALSDNTVVISKATHEERDAYSGFQDTDLTQQLNQKQITRLFIGGLATDVCVLNTVKDALASGFRVYLLEDAVRAVNVRPGDEQKALQEMTDRGAVLINENMVEA